MKDSFLGKEELQRIGFAKIGEDVRVSRMASIYSPEKMIIGSHVRIDDYCILSGKIYIENYVHISAYSALYGGNAGVKMKSYSGISGRVIVYAVSDDFNGGYGSNAMIPDIYRNPTEEEVVIGRHVIVGAGSIILPGVTLNDGCAIGSMSLVKHDCDEWMVYCGIPASKLKRRKKIDYNID